jgi:hypothetical protein
LIPRNRNTPRLSLDKVEIGLSLTGSKLILECIKIPGTPHHVGLSEGGVPGIIFRFRW